MSAQKCKYCGDQIFSHEKNHRCRMTGSTYSTQSTDNSWMTDIVIASSPLTIEHGSNHHSNDDHGGGGHFSGGGSSDSWGSSHSDSSSDSGSSYDSSSSDSGSSDSGSSSSD